MLALRRAPEGLSRSDIYSDVFNRNVAKDEIAGLLTGMLESGSVGYNGRKGSKDCEVWFAIEHESTAKVVRKLEKVNA
jgi:hypothetical protein